MRAGWDPVFLRFSARESPPVGLGRVDSPRLQPQPHRRRRGYTHEFKPLGSNFSVHALTRYDKALGPLLAGRWRLRLPFPSVASSMESVVNLVFGNKTDRLEAVGRDGRPCLADIDGETRILRGHLRPHSRIRRRPLDLPGSRSAARTPGRHSGNSRPFVSGAQMITTAPIR